MSNITWHTEQRRLGDLIDWDKNPRQLSKHDAEHIHRSLDTFGLADPLIINTDDRLIGGHQRKRILLSNGATADTLVDVRVPSRPLTEREAEELAIRLNKNSGDWDFDLLANGFDVPDLLDWGFTEEELQIGGFTFADKPEDPGAQIDKAEELREKWGVETGQLWQLGPHRLICGDCTDRAVVERVMGGKKVGLCFTSPPYSDQRDYNNDELSPKYLAGFIISSVLLVEYYCINLGIKREEGEIIQYWQDYIAVAKDAGMKLLAWNIWDKGRGGSVGAMTAMFPLEHEFVFVFGKTPRDLIPTIKNETAGQKASARVMNKNGTRTKPQYFIKNDLSPLGSVYRGRQVDKNDLHPAMFPVEFAEAYIVSFNGDIYDPFLGSGTTLIACERLGRKCRAVEISPAYCAVAIQRWVDMTGREPVLLDKQDV